MTTYYAKKVITPSQGLVLFICETCGASILDGQTASHDGFHERLHLVSPALFPAEDKSNVLDQQIDRIHGDGAAAALNAALADGSIFSDNGKD